jgi:hypothetical protein
MSSYSATPLPAKPTTAIADTGCTGHFLQIDDHAQHRQPTTNGIIVQMPSHSRIQATHTCQIYIPNLPTKACEAHLFPNLAHALLSIGLLCDHGCTAIFDKQHVKISYENAIILPGYRDPETNLWKGKCPSNQLQHRRNLLNQPVPAIQHSNKHCETKTLTSNSCRHTHIVATPPSVPYKRSKITLWHAFAQPTRFFPMRLWDRILPQATTTLNLLRKSRLNPRLSSEAHLNGTYDLNRTPLAPLGTRVIVHFTPETRCS